MILTFIEYGHRGQGRVVGPISVVSGTYTGRPHGYLTNHRLVLMDSSPILTNLIGRKDLRIPQIRLVIGNSVGNW